MFKADDDGDQDAPFDPHAWLDPENGKTKLSVIAATLSDHDPENAAIYAANTTVGKVEINPASRVIAATLAPVENLRLIVFHDAYQYFERRSDIHVSGAVSLGDASAPSPARVREIHDMAAKPSVTCALSAPKFSSGLVDAVFEGPARIPASSTCSAARSRSVRTCIPTCCASSRTSLPPACETTAGLARGDRIAMMGVDAEAGGHGMSSAPRSVGRKSGIHP